MQREAPTTSTRGYKYNSCSKVIKHLRLRYEREVLPTSSQKGLSRVGHERPLNTNSCADHEKVQTSEEVQFLLLQRVMAGFERN